MAPGTPKNPRREMDRPLEGAVLSGRLPSLLADLKAESIFDEERHNSRTVFKAPGLRVVLVAIKKGEAIARHKAARPLTLQVLEGRLRLRAGNEELVLGAGGLAHLGAAIPHDIEAVEESAFLLTIGGKP